MAVIDVDDPETWPTGIKDFTEQWGDRCAGSTNYTCDLPIPIEGEAEFIRLCYGHTLRAYHATRLLPHERDIIRSKGLRPLTAELVQQRIRLAAANGSIGADSAIILDAENVFTRGIADGRENQVCLFLSDYILREDVTALGDLLRYWGGEAMFKASMEVRPILANLGTPSIITASLDLADPEQPHSFFPALHNVFVAATMRLEDASCDVFFRSAIPGSSIERIAQPGDPWYDRYPALPR
jgi:hypothetical protein